MSSPVNDPTQISLPLLPLRDVVVFPHMVIPLFVGRPKSIKALEIAMESGKSILLVAQKFAAKDEPAPEDLYGVSTVANLLQMLKLPDGTVKVLVEGGRRASIIKVTTMNVFRSGCMLPPECDTQEGAMRRAMRAQLTYVQSIKKFLPNTDLRASEMSRALASQLLSFAIKLEQKQRRKFSMCRSAWNICWDYWKPTGYIL